MQAVVDAVSKPKKVKYYCHCVLKDNSEVVLTIKATSEAQASKQAHSGYSIQYVLEIFTQQEMERRKKHLRPSILATNVLR